MTARLLLFLAALVAVAFAGSGEGFKVHRGKRSVEKDADISALQSIASNGKLTAVFSEPTKRLLAEIKTAFELKKPVAEVKQILNNADKKAINELKSHLDKQ
ncbi:hypothetical protein AAVH_18694 [Aphelenchoides avenae]|nr:hypothetical protein AAVH_18694 [Aphelenchus avenae]